MSGDSEENSLSDLFQEVTGQDSVTTNQEQSDSRRLRDDENDTRPTTTEQCQECGNEKAYVELKQIRAADESETRFFECTECGATWREDDH